MTARHMAELYLSRFRFRGAAVREEDIIALEALLVMEREHGMSMAEWGNEEPTVTAEAPFTEGQ